MVFTLILCLKNDQHVEKNSKDLDNIAWFITCKVENVFLLNSTSFIRFLSFAFTQMQMYVNHL